MTGMGPVGFAARFTASDRLHAKVEAFRAILARSGSMTVTKVEEKLSRFWPVALLERGHMPWRPAGSFTVELRDSAFDRRLRRRLRLRILLLASKLVP